MSTRLFSLYLVCIALALGELAASQAIAQSSANRCNGQMKPCECNGQTKLCIGVRSDARPFSYKSTLPGEEASDAARGPLRRGGYTGYMIRICDAALAEMILEAEPAGDLTFKDIGFYDIDETRKSERGQYIKDHDDAAQKALPSTSASRFLYLGKRFDILCDPATITNERRDDFAVSPPLFLTGISYITRKGENPPDNLCSQRNQSLIGFVGGTTASNEGFKALLVAHELPKFEDALIKSLSEGGEQEPMCGKDTAKRVIGYETHGEAAKAFCNGEFFYYVGDLEIITENVKMIPGCAYDNGTRTYTNDRYAVFGRAIIGPNDGENTKRRLLVARFFEILSQKVVFNPSILDKAFSDTFQGVSPSRKLDLFYWSVRGERE